MGLWENDRLVNISTLTILIMALCNLSCQHQDFCTDMEELPETDWILICRLLLLSHYCCWRWRSWPQSQIKATTRIQSQERHCGGGNGCCRIHFSADEFLLSSTSWIIFLCSLLSCYSSHSHLPVEKNVSLFPQWWIHVIHGEKESAGLRPKKLSQGIIQAWIFGATLFKV